MEKGNSSSSSPVLLIQGDQDQNTPLHGCGMKSAGLVKNNRFIIYKGAAHGLFVTHHKRLNSDILHFFKEIEGSACVF
ncbi:alpha/beta fold hydrolase [Fictibacillus fluitans]|uniref:alpha/beta fold hydrolase n=1 Tax=Fictibacillus fluitans TaxID=3058422 RepID=UPI0033A0AD3A